MSWFLLADVMFPSSHHPSMHSSSPRCPTVLPPCGGDGRVWGVRGGGATQRSVGIGLQGAELLTLGWLSAAGAAAAPRRAGHQRLGCHRGGWQCVMIRIQSLHLPIKRVTGVKDDIGEEGNLPSLIVTVEAIVK